MKPKQKRRATQAPSAPATPRPAWSGWQKWTFRSAAMVLVPLLVFGVLELVLRVAGYGDPVSFFIKNPVPGQDTMVENHRFSRRYFAPELVRIPRPVAFSASKPPQTLRIFVLGESAAEGDPGPAYGFGRTLQVLLRQRFPGRKIELINTAVTAINSHVIRPIAGECADYSGDAWVIYMGNNEVVGPFGSGTVFGPQTPPLPLIRASIALQSSRTGQMLEDLLRRARSSPEPEDWGGMEMFLQEQVRQDDPRMARVYSHFEKNLTEMVRVGTRSRVKILVSTVPVNLRDCAPLGSLHRADLTAAQKAEWEKLCHAGIVAENEGKAAEAVTHYRRAAEIDNQFAELHFRWARLLAAQGQRDEARRHYALARDLDTLRFRTDSRLNDIIRRVAGQWKGRGVELADSEAMLARATADGVPGSEWFYDHVHLRFSANYLLGRQFAGQIAEWFPEAASAPTAANTRTVLSQAECEQALALTDWDQLRMMEEMSPRISRPPFTHQFDHDAQMARWWREMAALRARAGNTNEPSPVTRYQRALARAEDDWVLHDHFGGWLVFHGERAQAAEQYRRIINLLPHRIQTYDILGSLLIEQGQFDDAVACYQRLLQIRPDCMEGVVGLGRALLQKGHTTEAANAFRRAMALKPRSANARNYLGLALLQAGKNGEAVAAFRAATVAEPGFLPARLNLGNALVAHGQPDEAITVYQEAAHLQVSNASPWLAMAKVHSRQGRTNEMLHCYSEAVRRQPDDFDARQAFGNALIRLNRLREAIEHIAVAVRLRPDSAEARHNYGTLLANGGRTVEACAQFEEAVRLKPDFVPARFNLALARAEQGQLPQAIAHLREVLRLEPSNARARQLLESALNREQPR